jgi:tartrate dehydratase alpha subunit/fumarate hydratase class I-like protein
MSVSGLATFLISVENMNLLSSSIYKHLKTYLIKHKQSLILGECGSQLISVKNGGTDTKPMGKTEPQFLSDPMSDRKKKFSPTL